MAGRVPAVLTLAVAWPAASPAVLTLAVLTAQVASSFAAQGPRPVGPAPQDETARREVTLAELDQRLAGSKSCWPLLIQETLLAPSTAIDNSSSDQRRRVAEVRPVFHPVWGMGRARARGGLGARR